MSSQKSAAEKVRAELLEKSGQLDSRRLTQIRNQVSTINRLMQGGSYDDEMRKLHEDLADTQVRLDDALAQIRGLQAQQPSGYNLGQGT